MNACIDNFDNQLDNDTKEALTLFNNIPEYCPGHIKKIFKTGDIIQIANRCCVFEDFNVSSTGTIMSLEELFRQEKNYNQEIYSLQSFLQSWKYLQLAPKTAEVHLKPAIVSNARKTLENFVPNCKKVAIHLRILDASGPEEIYNFPGAEFFCKALQHFFEKWNCVKFLVFSDKPSWCREQSLFDNEHIIIMDWHNRTSVEV